MIGQLPFYRQQVKGMADEKMRLHARASLKDGIQFFIKEMPAFL
jgi:hypothetical protein